MSLEVWVYKTSSGRGRMAMGRRQILGVMLPQPRDTWNYQKREEVKTDPPQRLWGEHNPDNTLILEFLSPEL